MAILREIKDIAEVLPMLLIYIVPGYLFLVIKNYILGYDNDNKDNIVLKSILISYIFITIEEIFFKYLVAHPMWFSTDIYILIFKFYRYNISDVYYICSIIIFAITSAYIISRIVQTDKWWEITESLGIKHTLYSNIWDDIIKSKEGPYVRVYINAEKIMYDGKLKVYEHNKKENYFLAISEYISYDMGEKRTRKL